MGKRIIFVAGVFNTKDRAVMQNNIKLIAKVSLEFMEAGYCVLTPVLMGTKILDFYNVSTAFNGMWREVSFDYIDLCTEVHVICTPGWQDSKGVMEEIRYAESKNKPITYMEHTL